MTARDDLPSDSVMAVRAELRTATIDVQIAGFDLNGPIDNIMREAPGYRLNQCLTPRPLNARGCFVDAWGPHRFEPLGEIFLLPPGHRLHTRSESGRQASIVCEIAREAVEAWLDEPPEWTDRRLEAALDVPSPHIRTLLGRLAEEAYRPGLASAAIVDLLGRQVAIEVARFSVAIGDGPATGGLAAWRLRFIDERLRNLAAPPTLEELAELCNLSVRQLTRGFRASRGCSIKDHIARSRIEGAKRMLAGPDSVKAIAFALGFASPSSFAHAFRQATGITPREFRTRTRSETASH
jgi:AraC family transcriptional regulator